MPWYRSSIGWAWQQWICWSFIWLSGFCWQMGSKPWKRGAEVFLGGVVITVATILFMPDSRVIFGVLTLLGSSMLLMIPLHRIFKKIPGIIGALTSFFLFLFTYSVNSGYFGFGKHRIVALPREWYANLFTTYFGFMEKGFFSTDYFSILPWFFLFATGYFCYSIVFAQRSSEKIANCPLVRFMKKSFCPPLGWIGKNALIIYMLHQPLIYGVLYVWSMMK